MVLPSVVLMVLRKAQQSVVLLALQLALLSVLLWAAPMALQMVPLMVVLSVRSWGQKLPIHLNCRSRGGAPAASSTSSGASCDRGVPVHNSDTTRTLLGVADWAGAARLVQAQCSRWHVRACSVASPQGWRAGIGRLAWRLQVLRC